ncbi:MAG: MBOAT family O-acyltransferase [Rubricoccaceae bacterium]|nr:MBOAT family O-acyltransferase [Rubricoccaceae bacterium]
MLFNSLDFVFFFPAVVAAFFALPHRARPWLLLGASYFFYGSWDARYLLLLALSTVTDYGAGLAMGRRRSKRARRPWLLLSLGVNLGLLGAFKYSGMFAETANALFGWMGVGYRAPVLELLLPVGISFYTFQTLAYSIDVYRGRQAAERHFGLFALYVSFFPQLVAGPIERSQHLLPQFRERVGFEYGRAVSGLRVMLGGFMMKLLVADRVAPILFATYYGPEGVGAFYGWPAIIATYLFMAQFYCDFAGYSLIAIGAARVMGYDLMQNFDRPYFSASLNEFWRRWHISLMTWLRDYLWLPLNGGTNRVSKERGLLSLFLVFVLSGLWHGAAWTFVVWGTLHGVAIVIGNVTRKPRNRLWKRAADWERGLRIRTSGRLAVRAAGLPALRLPPLVPKLQRFIGVLVTFHIFTYLGVFFVAPSLGDVWSMYTAQFRFDQSNLGELIAVVGPYQFFLSIAVVVGLVAVEIFQGRHDLDPWIGSRPWPLRWAIYLACLGALLLFGAFGGQEFIYFQF